jgi:hypothetical protein
MTRVFDTFINRTINYGELLYEKDFPDWFVIQAAQRGWDWVSILLALRRGGFFFVRTTAGFRQSIVPDHEHSLTDDEAKLFGEGLIRKLAAFACTLPASESLMRSLQLDGFEVNKEKLKLVPLEGPVSAAEEEDRLTRLVKISGIPDSATILRHIADAQSLYSEGKDHPSLNESRSLIQALIDGISTETDTHGKHKTKLPGGTGPRIEFLTKVGFFTADEQAAFNSAWGSLSAGSHPGVPDSDQARIGLVLAFEFGQLLLLKFANWRSNGYKKFS